MKKARDTLEVIERVEDALVELRMEKGLMRREKQERKARAATLLDKLETLWDGIDFEAIDEEEKRIKSSCYVDGNTNTISLDSFYEEVNEIKKLAVNDPSRNEEANLPIIDYSKYPIADKYSFSTVPTERYGRYIELGEEYQKFLSTTTYSRHVEKSSTDSGAPTTTLSYSDYLLSLSQGDIGCGMEIVRNKDWLEYIKALSTTLEEFSIRRWPLKDRKNELEELEIKIKENQLHLKEKWRRQSETFYSNMSSILSDNDSDANQQGVLQWWWCGLCSVAIINSEAAKRHIEGKKHKSFCKKYGFDIHEVRYSQKELLLEQNETREEKFLLSCNAEETKVLYFADLAKYVIEDTSLRAEQRMMMTDIDEILKDEEDSEKEDMIILEGKEKEEKEAKNEEKKIWNPKNFPLDQNGVPIPVWLYKLNGLGIKEKCEICGGFVYQGRNTFAKHFNKERHVGNLKLLGIKYTNAFYGITSIEEAKELDKYLKTRIKKQDTFIPEDESMFNKPTKKKKKASSK